jgi:lipopolysaccharide/colanic/teichoic acid biosynthesis glycosyltransferase
MSSSAPPIVTSAPTREERRSHAHLITASEAVAHAPVEWGVDASNRLVDIGSPDAIGDVVPRERNATISRTANIVLAVIGMILALPVLIVLAIMIKLDSRGPVLYSQSRVGLDRRWRPTSASHEARREDLGGRLFTIYKLRSMYIDAEETSGAIWATANDPRTTKVGRFLRKYRLDELPQLWNVLRGDMNIVGPRPERPSIVATLRGQIPEYRFRQRVKPGITGLAQINQSYDASLDDVRAKVGWDLHYIRQQSLWLDLRVILQTVPTVLLKFRGW